MANNKIDCFSVTCDNCGELFETVGGHTIFPLKRDPDLAEYDWYSSKDGETHYCEMCYHFDNEDNLVIDELRKQKS